MIKIKKIINCLSNPGFYKSYFNGVSPLFEITPLLQKIGDAKTLIDIGSNKGQSILITKKFFPNILVYSFEPLEDQINLQKKIIGNKNIFYHNLAIGNKDEISSIHVTNRKDSSSVLKPINIINSNYITKEIQKVKIKKLDSFKELMNIRRPSIMKIDVQGFELEVLEGSELVLNNIDYIIIEISYSEVYQNQKLQDKIINFLNSKNFNLVYRCNESFINNKKFQEDVLFVKINNNQST